MNIFLRELKANRKALIIWIICMIFLMASGMTKYSAYATGNGQSISELLGTMPSSLKALMGFSSFDVGTMAGYFGVLFVYTELTVAIHAALLGAGIIAKEERDKTAEFLMTMPVSRQAVITAKFLAALFNIVVVNLVTWLTALAVTPAYNNGVGIPGEISKFMISMFFIQLIFLAAGAFLAAVLRNPKGAGSLATGVLLIGYFLARVTDMYDSLSILNILSPFKYFDLPAIARGEGLNLLMIGACIVLTAALCYSTYYFYHKRDLDV